MALSPIVSSNPITEIFNLQEEANVRYEKIASTWDQSTDDAWASIQYNKGTQSVGQKVSIIYDQTLTLLVYLQKQSSSNHFGQRTKTPRFALSSALFSWRVPVENLHLLKKLLLFFQEQIVYRG